MIKRITTCLFTFALLTQSHAIFSKDFPDWRKNPFTPESFAAAARLIDQGIDKKLQPMKQSATKRTEINNFKQKYNNAVYQQLLALTTIRHCSDRLIKDEAIKLAEGAGDIFIRESAHKDIVKALYDAGYRDERDPIYQKIYRKVIFQVETDLEYLITNDRSVWSYLQDSTKNIRDQVEKELPKKVADKDITEIYPNGNPDTILAKKAKGLLDRKPSCVTCKKDFGSIVAGKKLNRVNLSCGHANICPACLDKRVHTNKVTSCPNVNCYERIDPTEFPPAALR